MVEMMAYYESIREALYDELKSDESVFLMGEDIRYNLYAYTYGLFDVFGGDRIIDIPLSEAAVVGTAIGAAMCGLRPILDLTVSNFLYVAMDQIASMAAKTAYQYNGRFRVPLTIMASSAYGNNAGAQHSDRLHGLFMEIPGLKVAVPSNPQDMYSLLRASIRDNNPVICFQDKNVFYEESGVDRGINISLGVGKKICNGNDVTLIGICNPANMMGRVANKMIHKGISCDVIDIRTVVPMDEDMILESVKKTGRVVISDSNNRKGGTASYISSFICERAFNFLKSPIRIVATEDVPLPYSKSIENELIPSEKKIEEAILYVAGRES